MSPESPGNLIAIDLQLVGKSLECDVDRYDPVPMHANEWLYVSWNAIECPDQYVPVGKAVAYVWVPPHFMHRQYRARVDPAGDGYEWIDRESGLGLMLILTLPKDLVYLFPGQDEPGPRPIRFKRTADDRLALYWWLKGDQGDGRVGIFWRMVESSAVDITAHCNRLNEEARRVKPSGAYPVHMDQPPHAAAGIRSRRPSVLKVAPDWHEKIALVAESIIMDRSVHITAHVVNSPGAIANVAEYMSDVTSHVVQHVNESDESEEIKRLVKQLAEQISAIDPSVNPEKVKDMGDDLTTLSNEMAKSKPRRRWYEVSLEGIKEAALAIGEVGEPIVKTVTMLMPFLVVG